MNMLKCQLYNNAATHPGLSFIRGPQAFTYLEFESYVQQIQKLLCFYKPGQVIASCCKNPPFFIALLIAAMRQKLIVLPINFRLPPDEVNKITIEVNAAHIFDQSIPFNPNCKLTLKEAPTYCKSDPITYLMTSGSTSAPKMCVHSIGSHYCNAKASNKFLQYTQDDAWLLSMPLFHVSGISIVFRTLIAKATIVLASKDNANDILSHKVTHLSCVNTQLQRLLKAPQTLKPLKVILLGGSAPSSDLVNKAKNLKLPLHTTYGLTEMASQVATSENANGSLKVLDCAEVKIGAGNQILVRGQSLFSGYLIKGEILPSTNIDGWFETGDLGELDYDQLTVTGRRDNLFISGGENIQPEEIELFLQKYPGITEAIVVAKPHAEFGYVPAAFIKVEDDFNAADLKEFLEKKLPGFKIPKLFLPLIYNSLKPCRKKLRLSIEN